MKFMNLIIEFLRTANLWVAIIGGAQAHSFHKFFKFGSGGSEGRGYVFRLNLKSRLLLLLSTQRGYVCEFITEDGETRNHVGSI